MKNSTSTNQNQKSVFSNQIKHKLMPINFKYQTSPRNITENNIRILIFFFVDTFKTSWKLFKTMTAIYTQFRGNLHVTYQGGGVKWISYRSFFLSLKDYTHTKWRLRFFSLVAYINSVYSVVSKGVSLIGYVHLQFWIPNTH